VLHLHHFLVRMRDEVLDDVLLAQPVAAGHRVVEVRSRLSCACVTAAAPPSAATVWLRIG
jgi:hypothetical protein